MGSRRTSWLGVVLAGGLALTLSRGWAAPEAPPSARARPLVEPGGARDPLGAGQVGQVGQPADPSVAGNAAGAATTGPTAGGVLTTPLPPSTASLATVLSEVGEPQPAEVGGGLGEEASPVSVLDEAPAALSSTGEVLATGSLAEVRAAVLTRMSYPWQARLPQWSIEFLPGRPGYLGATWTNERRIEIYVRDGQTVDELAFTLAHELGHAVDLTYLSAKERDRWLAARGRPGAPWWTDSGASDYAVGAGDWAEAFAVWQVGGTSLSTLAGQPSAEQLRLVAELAS